MYIIYCASKGIILLWVKGYQIRRSYFSPFLFANCLRTNAYLNAIVSAVRPSEVLWQHINNLPSDNAAKVIPNLLFYPYTVLKNSPFSFTPETLSKRLSTGILNLLKIINPLSIAFKPNLGPQSPIVIPGNTRCVFGQRKGTTNACTPQFFYFMQSCAQTTHIFDVFADPPIQNFMASFDGE